MADSKGESAVIERLRAAIAEVPDFPKPGIAFKDITPLLADPELLQLALQAMARPFEGDGVTQVVAIESRGFILGAPIATMLGAGLIPIRKPGKLPRDTGRVEYDLEYGTDALEMHDDALKVGDRVLIVDDVMATGGTAGAAGQLVRKTGAELVGHAFLLELRFLNGREKLDGARAEAVLKY